MNCAVALEAFNRNHESGKSRRQKKVGVYLKHRHHHHCHRYHNLISNHDQFDRKRNQEAFPGSVTQTMSSMSPCSVCLLDLSESVFPPHLFAFWHLVQLPGRSRFTFCGSSTPVSSLLTLLLCSLALSSHLPVSSPTNCQRWVVVFRQQFLLPGNM